MIYIGIDPGKNGGIAIINENTNTNYSMPYSERDLRRYTRLLKKNYENERIMCCLEQVHAMPGQGVTSMFNFGMNYGYIKGVLETLGIPYQEVTPAKWKKEFGLSGTKADSIEVCQRLFPGVDLMATERSRKPHDGMAEALLMAEYARRKLV